MIIDIIFGIIGVGMIIYYSYKEEKTNEVLANYICGIAVVIMVNSSIDARGINENIAENKLLLEGIAEKCIVEQ